MEIPQIIQELKEAREAKGITLSQISDSTMIGLHFLEAIEAGNLTVLPQTYVRAFIREYAVLVGLDPADVMHRYDLAFKESESTVPLPDQQTREPAPAPRGVSRRSGPLLSGRTAILAIAVLVTGALVIGIWNLSGSDNALPTQEVPFQNVIKENEQRLAPPQSAPRSAPAAVAPSTVDSLTLRGVATDSVWVQLVIDHEAPREYLFPPKSRASWRARERFVLTLGNAGGMEFTLNQKDLGTFGKRGFVVRNIELNRQTLTHQ
jgi:cytoskeletal protein RodZ